MKKLLCSVLLAAPLSVLACDINKIEIMDMHVLAGPQGQNNAAGYGIIKNNGDTQCILSNVAASISKKTELHIVTHENNMMKMQAVPSLPIPAHGELALSQGGAHIMFINLYKPLVVDSTFPATFKFADNGEKAVEFKVKAM